MVTILSVILIPWEKVKELKEWIEKTYDTDSNDIRVEAIEPQNLIQLYKNLIDSYY